MDTTSHLEYLLPENLYGSAFVDIICERAIARMEKRHLHKTNEAKARQKYRRSNRWYQCSPGCHTSFKITPRYDMPGSGKCMMEYAIRRYANVAEFRINCNASLYLALQGVMLGRRLLSSEALVATPFWKHL
jgi:hypothetical protein